MANHRQGCLQCSRIIRCQWRFWRSFQSFILGISPMLEAATHSARPAPRDAPYRIVPAEIAHVYPLAAVLRPRVAAEIAGSGHSAKRSLYRGFRNSILCKTAFVGDDIAAM